MSTPITLKEIYESATGLLKRFDLMPSLDTAWLKFLEEFTEASEALYELQCRPRNDLLRSAAAMELCDCLVTMMNILYAAEILDDEIDILKFKLMTFWQEETEVSRKDAWIKTHFHVNTWYVWLRAMRNNDGISWKLFKDHPMYVIKSLLALARVYGLSFADVERSMESVMFKNNQKTHATHEIVDGMIKKRKPQGESAS